jgi:selenocysteine-specific elongation factor
MCAETRAVPGRTAGWSGPGPVPRTAFKAVGGAPRAPGRFDSFAAPLTLCTAGHVDHGKTTLVGALTGVDTDRLAEEKARGLTIALGYAPLALPSGRQLSLVDVPGHERFVRTMVAGASGVDLFLLVIAADDGAMPQTLEHLRVLQALDIKRGVVAITKADLADPAAAARQAAELLPGCAAVPCCARTGNGLGELMSALESLAARLPSRAGVPGAARLHVDRSFTVVGRGAVVTGTLWAGSIGLGDELELLPAAQPVRVRGVQVHDAAVQRAAAGQRVAVNLTGVKTREARRGDVLAAPGTVRECTILDCALELSRARHGERVQVHHGTRAAPARLAALGENLWQLRLEQPLLALAGDRLVVRRQAPPDTIGGGVVLDAHARRHGRRPELLAQLKRVRDGGSPGEQVAAPADAARRSPRGETPAEPAVAPPPDVLLAVERRLREAGTGLLSESQLERQSAALRTLRREGRAVRVSGRLYAHAEVLGQARREILALIEREGTATLAGVRDALGISRKSAQAFLEHLDGALLTRRLPDDRRVLTPRAGSAGGDADGG